MGEKDKNNKYVMLTSDGMARRTLIADDLLHDISEKLVEDADMKVGNGENDRAFQISLSFNADYLKNTFAWKILFGSNNWRKLHGMRMRRRKWLRY